MVSRKGWIVPAGGLALVAAGAWLWHSSESAISASDDEESARLVTALGPRAEDARPERESVALSGVESESASNAARPRAQGYFKDDPGTLVAISGRVIDTHSDLAVSGLELSFLSRRPKTVRVVTDANGCFTTGLELSSGMISVMHVPDPTNPPFAARVTLEPSQFVVAASLDGAPRRVVLHARSPERVLELDVALPDGAPASSAAVTLTWGARDGEGAFQAEGHEFELADARGRARFALTGDELVERILLLEADLRGNLASDVLTLEPPVAARPWKLDLYPGADLRVACVNDRGAPVSGVSLWLSTNEVGRYQRGHNGDSDASGECVFNGLRAGCYTLSALHPFTGERLTKDLDLARGAQPTVRLRLSVANLHLGASGSVVDEQGEAIEGVELEIQNGNEAPVRVETRQHGHFEFWGAPSNGVCVRAGGGFQEDPFEPAVANVAFGTQGLCLRRAGKQESISLPVELVAQDGGARPGRGSVTLFMREPRRAQQSFSVACGVTQVSFKSRKGIGYAVDAPGYLRAEGELEDLLNLRSAGAPLWIELERGFARTVEIRDRASKRTLAHASLADGMRVLATSDEHGRAELVSETWPALVHIECAGYEPLAWDPFSAGYPGDVLWMEPVRTR